MFLPRVRVSASLPKIYWVLSRLTSIDKLKNANDLSDVAKLFGYKPKNLSYILYKIPNDEKYTTIKIPKKDGNEREINAPEPRLKLLQRRLSHLLQQYFEEIYGTKNFRRSLSHGFRSKHSIITNAQNHRNKRYVFNVDLKDFFPSINFGRVRGYFIKNKDFQLEPKVATVIAQIVCHDNVLPQGSPTSPVISNLIGHILDTRLVKLAKKAKCAYSRYADDLTFSTNEKNFPPLIAKEKKEGEWIPSKELEKVAKRSGFDINAQKVSMQYETHRQMATGLVVNRKVNIRASYYRQARAMCNKLFQTGEFYIGKEMRWGKPKNDPTRVRGTVNQLRGILNYIYYVKNRHDERDLKDKKKNPTAIYNLHQRFLYFDKFYNLDKPLVLCEGKTDIVYLKCALKSLADAFPSMIDTSSSETKWKLDFFKYSKLNKELMGLSGGTGEIASLISKYKERMEPFKCPTPSSPVIILVDKDAGANCVLQEASKLSGTNNTIDGSEDFYHLYSNLYLVSVPIPQGQSESMIEDCFAKSVKSIRVDEKSFNPNKKHGQNTEYGKEIFAQKVVKPNQASIDFIGFKPLLKRLEAAIEDYATKSVPS